MVKLVEARVQHRFESAAEQLYDAWLDHKQVRQWLGKSLRNMGLSGEISRVEIDAQIGGKFTFSDMRETGEAVHWGYYRELQRPRRIVFSWFVSEEDEIADSSLVTLAIEAQDKGCTATISHCLDAQYAEYIPQTEKGWKAMLSSSSD